VCAPVYQFPHLLHTFSLAPVSVVFSHNSFTPVLEHTGQVPRQSGVDFIPLPLLFLAIFISPIHIYYNPISVSGAE